MPSNEGARQEVHLGYLSFRLVLTLSGTPELLLS